MREFKVKEWLKTLDESGRFGGTRPPIGQRTRPGFENSIDRVLDAYRDSQTRGLEGQAELELRFQAVDIEQFVRTFEKLRSDRAGAKFQGIRQYVRLIQQANDGTDLKNITQYQIEPGGAMSRSSYAKHVVRSELIARDVWHRNHPFRLCYSREVPSVHNVSETAHIVRLMMRASFDYPTPDRMWRIDMSLIWQGNTNREPSWQSVYSRLFAQTDIKKPYELLQWLQRVVLTEHLHIKAEIEAEYIGKPGVLGRSMILGSSQQLLGGIVGQITQTLDPGFHRGFHYQKLMGNIAGLLGKKHLATDRKNGILTTRQIAPQVRTLGWTEYKNEIFPPEKYFVSPKTDGVRAFAYVKDGCGYILTDKIEYSYNRAHFVHHDKDWSYYFFNKATLVDGELLDDGRFQVLDVLLVAGKRVFTLGFEQRITHFDAAARELSHVNINVCQKKFVEIGCRSEADLSQIFNSISIGPGQDYPRDGLIIVEPGFPYLKTRSFKWKPPEQQTIDFLAKAVPQDVLETIPLAHRPDSVLHFLFVGADRSMDRCLRLPRCLGYDKYFTAATRSGASDYIAVPFSPSDEPQAYFYWHTAGDIIDGKIVELRANLESRVGKDGFVNWIFERERTDRLADARKNGYVGNNIRIAELTWRNYSDPILIDHLITGRKKEYFHRASKRRRTNQVVNVSAAKQRTFDCYLSRADWVVDIGAGRGQDLHRYFGVGIRNVVAVDRDQSALTELVGRKLKVGINADRYEGTRCFVLPYDMNRSHSDLIKRIHGLPDYPEHGCNAVVCNLAIHYFAGLIGSMQRFAKLCASLIRPDGLVILTLLNGENVHRLFIENGIRPGSMWQPNSESRSESAIVRLYKENQLLAAGQQIALRLPFTAGMFYPEPLINTKTLIAAFAGCSFQLIERSWAMEASRERQSRKRRVVTLGECPKQSMPYETLVFRR